MLRQQFDGDILFVTVKDNQTILPIKASFDVDSNDVQLLFLPTKSNQNATIDMLQTPFFHALRALDGHSIETYNHIVATSDESLAANPDSTEQEKKRLELLRNIYT